MAKKKKNTEIKQIEEIYPIDSDENFAFIAGYTSGGAPYGITHDEMTSIEKENNNSDNIER